MRAVLPGKPQAQLQALCTAQWQGLRVVVYISGTALVILGGSNNLIQTIYHEEHVSLVAVSIDETSGKIGVASSEEVYIYRPYGKQENSLKWSLQFSFSRHNTESETTTLSWGSEEELLLGSTSLRLYQTSTEAAEIWNRKLPKPVKLASFSYDATLIASTGCYDRLVKLWRRQSFGSEDTRFDFTYLSHPTAITAIYWRRPSTHEQALDHILYTICGDKKLRIWATIDPHGVQGLQLWGEIDIQESIQPRQFGADFKPEVRYAFIVDSRDFSHATEGSIVEAAENGLAEQAALEHLKEIARSSPEICVVMDQHGHMSAWGLEHVGSKGKKPTDIFNVAHVEDVQLFLPKSGTILESNVRFLGFCDKHPGSMFTLLVHLFDGRIQWIEIDFSELFDPLPRQRRVRLKQTWTGHDRPIKKIVRSVSGKAVMSRTNTNEALMWKQDHSDGGLGLTLIASLKCNEHIHRSWVLNEGNFVANLHHQSISLWDARASPATQIAACGFHLEGQLLCLVQLPNEVIQPNIVHLATITSTMKGIVWQVHLPRPESQDVNMRHGGDHGLRQICTFDLCLNNDLAFVIPVDPAGSTTLSYSFLDSFAKDVAISYSYDGILRSWTAAVNTDKSTVDWLVTSTVETGIAEPSLASASSIRKAALVDASRTGLTIWDMRSGQLEHSIQYDVPDLIQDLDWSSTPDDQSLLAIGFPHRVVVMAQMRYDYLNVGPAWAPIREIYIKGSTSHPIGDSTWLGSGNLLVGAGNQLFVYDRAVASSDDMISDLAIPVHKQGEINLFDLTSFLNGPLPLFHPQFLSQCILAGKLDQVQKVILGLKQALKFFSDGDELDSFVSLQPEDFITQGDNFHATRKDLRSSYANQIDEEESESVSESLAASLNDTLTKISIPQLSGQEQMQLADIIECVATAEKHRRSMDENAMRFLHFFRQYLIAKNQMPADRAGITFREIVWAYHSGTQDILVDLVSRQFRGKMLWGHARESGMFIWMTDLTALRMQFEIIARNEYAKTDEKNPIDCSLYYLALRKKNVLVGLWRMAAWNREQASTYRLLSNNFQDSRWKTAALKNAYALLGKRRFEYAAAFFLLAGNLQDAVNVCLHQLRDLQLAVAIARVYEGDDGLVLRSLLEDKVLPQAALEGNRWLATWAFWMLGKRDMAVRTLISPVYTLLDTPEAPNMQARSYLSSDPALVVLYKQLREKTLQTLKGASKVSPRAEWEFVIENARLYDRMGCDLLALDLVRNWEFLIQPKTSAPLHIDNDSPPDPRKMLRRRSSLVVDDLSSPKSPTGMKAGVGKAPPQKVFEEPDGNSLLDSFGF